MSTEFSLLVFRHNISATCAKIDHPATPLALPTRVHCQQTDRKNTFTQQQKKCVEWNYKFHFTYSAFRFVEMVVGTHNTTQQKEIIMREIYTCIITAPLLFLSLFHLHSQAVRPFGQVPAVLCQVRRVSAAAKTKENTHSCECVWIILKQTKTGTGVRTTRVDEAGGVHRLSWCSLNVLFQLPLTVDRFKQATLARGPTSKSYSLEPHVVEYQFHLFYFIHHRHSLSISFFFLHSSSSSTT